MAGQRNQADQADEKIIEIEIERLRTFKDHPFHVKDAGYGKRKHR